jgi:heme-degrading monooxygenase HmoA
LIIALVQFVLAAPMSIEEATKRFESSAPKYQNLSGLLRKHYVRSEDGRRAGGIYVWESRAAAEALYSGGWKDRVEKLYGVPPTIIWFDNPVSVDNTNGSTIIAA